jgi:hypothetical protein
MDLWHISGAILSDEGPDGWAPLATFSNDLPMVDCEGSEDPVYSLLRAIRLWSEMTIQG